MMYMVSENEMRSLANYNHLVAAFLSLAFSLIAFAGGLAIQAAQQSHANHQAWVLVEIVGAVCGLLAVVLFIGAVFVALARRDEIQRIKGETRTLEG
jgi:heme/copper-type cytochrome/quinol oxidase subunit 2